MNDYIYSILLSMMPIAELRGGIPYALANDIHPVTAYLMCCAANILAFPIVYLFMGFFMVNLVKCNGILICLKKLYCVRVIK